MYKMKMFCFVLLLSALANLPYSAIAQKIYKDTKHNLTTKEVWAGSIKVTFSNPTWVETIEGKVKFEYDYSLGNGIEDFYKLTGGSLTWSASGGDGECAYIGGPTAIMIDTNNTDGDMIVRSDGRYTINTWLLNPPGIIYIIGPSCNEQFPATLQSILWVPFLDPYYYLSDSGRTMVGTYSEPLSYFTWEWNLSSDMPELEIEIVDYDNWRPEALLDESTPGRNLTIKARLLNPDGTLSNKPADDFVFELLSTSKEPGIAMNYPLPNLAKNDFDLKFLEWYNPDGTKSDSTNQWIEMPTGVQSQAILTSFDWGAYCVLKVIADVDGIEIIGYLKGNKQEKEFRIPKRTEYSLIADIWKSENNAAGLADVSDLDDEPNGDSHYGDGLTVYEEYRGFIENGKHITTDPFEKDLFIRDNIRGRSKTGIALFQAASNLVVHHEFESSEFPNTRIINSNHDNGPHLVDQHGIIITKGIDEYSSEATGGPGLPRQVSDIQIGQWWRYGPIDLVRFRSGGGNIYASHNAGVYSHELGHAVNIWHHGEIDEKVNWSIKRDGTGRIERDTLGLPIVLENGNLVIEIFMENLQRIVPLWLQANPINDIWVGYRGGQHSGDELCFMRYNCANSYAISNQRFLIRDPGTRGSESAGELFCELPFGTGVNDLLRNPQSRYGDASNNSTIGPVKRGACLKRICVNDALPDH